MSPQHPTHPPAAAPAWTAPPTASGVRAALRRLLAPTREELPPMRAWGPWWMAVLVVVAFVAIVWGVDAFAPEGIWRPVLLEAGLLVALVALVLARRTRIGAASSPLRGTRVRLRWLIGGPIAVLTVATLAGIVFQELLGDMDGIGHTVPSGFEGRLAAFLAMVVLAPIVEETVFRGWLLRSLAARIAPVWAVVISGAVFGALHLWLAHYALGMGLELVFAGMTLGLLCLHSGSLLPNIAGHMTLNLIAFVSVLEPNAAHATGAVLVLSGLVLAEGWLRRNRRAAKRTTLAVPRRSSSVG